MVILGIDPGIASTGFGVIEADKDILKLKEHGCIRTTPLTESSKRLQKIYKEVRRLIRKYQPTEMVTEQLFVNTNVKTALAVGQARGAALLAAADHNVKTFEYTPLQVKQAVVGYGKAKKEQIQYMVKSILSLKDDPKPDDAADALALAICHAHSHKLLEKTDISKAPNPNG